MSTLPPTPAGVLGTATLFLRPLRYLFDVENSVSILQSRPNGNTTDGVQVGAIRLGTVHVHISIAPVLAPGMTHDPFKYEQDQAHPHHQWCVDAAAATDAEHLGDLIGGFVCVRVRMHPEGDAALLAVMATHMPRVQYQLAPALETFVTPVEHTTTFKVLVTEDLVAYFSEMAVQFHFLPPPPPSVVKLASPREDKKYHRDEEDEHYRHEVDTRANEEAEAARIAATSAAALAAENAARAAQLASAAATAALEASAQRERDTLTREQERERERKQERERDIAREQERERERLQLEIQARAEAQAQALALARAESKKGGDDEDRQRAIELMALKKDHEMELLRYTATLDKERGEKEQILRASGKLEEAVHEKHAIIQQCHEQAAHMDQAIELLKERMAGDAKEREEMQRRLRVLEEEKLELLKKKSRACVIQ